MDNFSKPFISIVIPTRNNQDTLKECLESLMHLNYPKERMEIVIADGMSTDNTRKIATSYGATLVINPKQTTATGRNSGFENATGDLIAYADADCVMDENWLEKSLKYFQDQQVAGVTGPTLTPIQQNVFAKAVAFLFSLSVFWAKSSHKETQEVVQEVGDLPGCNAIYRKEALNMVMPLDETLIAGSDIEMNYGLKQQGYRLLSTPDVTVWHYKRETPRGFWQQMYRYAIGRLQIAKKYPQLLNIAHVAIGLSVPFVVILLSLFFLVNPSLVLFFMGSVFTLILLVCLFAFLKTRSLKIAICLPSAIAILVMAWSIGFCRELILPVRGVQ